MKLFFFISSLLLVLSFEKAQASVDAYGSMMVGSASMDETVGANSFTNKNTFFVGHFGFAGGLRLLMDIGMLSFGGIGELAWIGDSTERKQVGSTTNNATYRNESTRVLTGFSSVLKFPALALIGEYYPWVQNTNSYSDVKSENPYRKNDKLRASGFGLGISFGWGIGSYMAMYRQLTYKDVEMNGTGVSLPTAQYAAYKVDEVVVGYVFKF